jgi:hypothetical protein
MIIIGQSPNKLITQDRTVKDLSIMMRLVNAAGTGSVAVFPVLRNITLRARLIRGGHEHVCFEDNLQNLVVDSHWEDNLESVSSASYLVQKGNGNALLPIRVKLPGVMNVTGTDKLELEVNILNGTYAAGFNIPSCQADIDWVDAKGIETAIPKIEVKYIPSGSGQWNESLGDDVVSVLVHNYDLGFTGSTAYTDAQTVFSAVNITSKSFNLNETADRLHSRLLDKFETQTACFFRGQSHKLHCHAGHHLHTVQLNLTMVPANVTAGNNVIVIRRFVYDGHTSIKAHHATHHANKDHHAHLVKRIGAANVAQAKHAFTHGTHS